MVFLVSLSVSHAHAHDGPASCDTQTQPVPRLFFTTSSDQKKTKIRRRSCRQVRLSSPSDIGRQSSRTQQQEAVVVLPPLLIPSLLEMIMLAARATRSFFFFFKTHETSECTQRKKSVRHSNFLSIVPKSSLPPSHRFFPLRTTTYSLTCADLSFPLSFSFRSVSNVPFLTSARTSISEEKSKGKKTYRLLLFLWGARDRQTKRPENNEPHSKRTEEASSSSFLLSLSSPGEAMRSDLRKKTKTNWITPEGNECAPGAVAFSLSLSLSLLRFFSVVCHTPPLATRGITNNTAFDNGKKTRSSTPASISPFFLCLRQDASFDTAKEEENASPLFAPL